MRAMKLLPVLLLPCALLAQNRPQFVWQGEVDGIVVLHLRDNRLNVQLQEGGPVGGQQFQFYERLPETRQEARLDIREARGAVRIVDQPRLENGYSLTVSIEDRQPGKSAYSIALYWDASNRVFERSGGRTDRIAWSGHVDQEAMVSCRARSCVAEAAHGSPIADERVKFSRPLPNREIQVTLEEAQGRGEIRLVEQPSERNQYTARVSIRDPQTGIGDYSFLLVWNRAGRKEPDLPSTARGFTWSGTVEGRVRVTVQGGASFSQAVAGRPVKGERADFLRSLPARSDLTAAVKKLQGRGEVQVIEQPSDKNNYRLVFEIQNPAGEADNYEIEVDW